MHEQKGHLERALNGVDQQGPSAHAHYQMLLLSVKDRLSRPDCIFKHHILPSLIHLLLTAILLYIVSFHYLGDYILYGVVSPSQFSILSFLVSGLWSIPCSLPSTFDSTSPSRWRLRQ